MDTTTISFDRLPHVVSGLSAKIDRVLELLEKGGSATHSQQHKPGRRIVHAKEVCTIIGKSLRKPPRIGFLFSENLPQKAFL